MFDGHVGGETSPSGASLADDLAYFVEYLHEVDGSAALASDAYLRPSGPQGSEEPARSATHLAHGSDFGRLGEDGLHLVLHEAPVAAHRQSPFVAEIAPHGGREGIEPSLHIPFELVGESLYFEYSLRVLRNLSDSLLWGDSRLKVVPREEESAVGVQPVVVLVDHLFTLFSTRISCFRSRRYGCSLCPTLSVFQFCWDRILGRQASSFGIRIFLVFCLP